MIKFSMKIKWGIVLAVLSILAFLIYTGYIYLLLELPLKVKSLSPDELKKKKYTHIVVLSGGCRGYKLLGISSVKRLESALEVYKKGVKVILAGEFSCGKGQHIGVGFLKERGIPPEDIVELSQSNSTIEDCKRAANYLKKNNVKTPVLITSFYHAKRVKIIFSSLYGKDFILYSSNLFKEKFDYLQKRKRLSRLLFHEYGGLLYWYLKKLGLYGKQVEKIRKRVK